MTVTEPAYAKLNLSLDILGRRPDGYHDLKMVMQSVDLHDTVSVTFREGRALHWLQVLAICQETAGTSR